jgi:uncharacterized repeat protein (TIGR01451 family)
MMCKNGHRRQHRPRNSGELVNNLRLASLLTLALFCLPPAELLAAGTAAGTIVSNAATVSYRLGSETLTASSNVNTFRVDDKVSFNLVSADASNCSLTPGGRGYLTFNLTNTGNAAHDYALSIIPTGSTPPLSAVSPRFYADQTGTIPLPTDANAGGLPYVTSLAPDSTRTVYLFIPAPADLPEGQLFTYQVTAESYQPANLGLVNPPLRSADQAAMDAPVAKHTDPLRQFVVLADGHGNGGDADRDGKFAVIPRDGNGTLLGCQFLSTQVSIVKAVAVIDQAGGSLPAPGSTLRYTLNVNVTGSGTARGVVISDPLPTNTSYKPGSLTLNNTPLSDGADGDAGDVGITAARTVTVRLGDMTSSTPLQLITFEVTID